MDRPAALVVIGVRSDGVKEVLAIEDGYRASIDSWATVLHDIMGAPDKAASLDELTRFAREFGDKYPKAVVSLTCDQGSLFPFIDFPAAHWIHLRTTNVIESTFATVKARTRGTKGAGLRQAGLAIASLCFSLISASVSRSELSSSEMICCRFWLWR